MTLQSPHPMDIHVGSRLQLMRKIRKFTQNSLAQKLNITFQQVQKYEQGTNRVSASRLFSMAQILDVPITFFFDDFIIESSEPSSLAQNPQQISEDQKLLTSPESLEFVRYFYAIKDKEIRHKLLHMIRVIGHS